MRSSYAETKAAELVAAMYSPKLKGPLKTKLGDAALAVVREVIEDCALTVETHPVNHGTSVDAVSVAVRIRKLAREAA